MQKDAMEGTFRQVCICILFWHCVKHYLAINFVLGFGHFKLQLKSIFECRCLLAANFVKCNYLNGSCIKVQPLYFITHDFRSLLIRLAAFLWCEAIHIINLLHSPQSVAGRGAAVALCRITLVHYSSPPRLQLLDMLMMEMVKIFIDS